MAKGLTRTVLTIAYKRLLIAVSPAIVVGVALGAVKLSEYCRPYVDLNAAEERAFTHNRDYRERNRLRFAVATIVTPKNTYERYYCLVDRIAKDIGREVAFVVVPLFGRARDDIESGRVGVAFVCTGTYAHARVNGRAELLVHPEFQEGKTCRSFRLVPAASRLRTWTDLRGRTFAFTDPESFTGYVVPRAEPYALGFEPGTFFAKTYFTGSYDRSIAAAVAGIVDAAAVDFLIWDEELKQDPPLAARIRVA